MRGREAGSDRDGRPIAFPFRRKLALAFALFGVGPLALIGALLIDANEDALRRSTLELQIALADGVGATVARQRDEAAAAASEIGALLGDASIGEHERLARATERFEQSPLLRLTVRDPAGVSIDSFRRADPEAPPTAAAMAQLSGALRVSADIRDRAGQTRGSVEGELALRPIRDRIQEVLDRHPGAAGAIAVLDPDAMPLVSISREASIDRSADRPNTNAPARGARESVHWAIERPVSLEGLRAPRATETDDAIATLAPIRGDPAMAVLVQTRPAAAFATLTRLRQVVVGSCVALALIAIIFGLGLARRITRPLEALSHFAGALAERRFDAPLDVQTPDEIGALAEDLRHTAKELAQSDERIRREQAIRSDLGRYLASDLVERIVRREQTMELGGRRADITVLFADVVAFTPLSRTLPPEDVVALLNELFTLLTEAVFRHGGTVDKLVGDAVMAVFGAPADDPEHAASAVSSAEAMMAIVETASGGWQDRYGVTLQLAIGIHSGEAVVGNVGSERRMDYTAIGEVVNLAARLETIARPRQILLSAATAERLGEGFDLTSVGERSVGETPLALFEVQP